MGAYLVSQQRVDAGRSKAEIRSDEQSPLRRHQAVEVAADARLHDEVGVVLKVKLELLFRTLGELASVHTRPLRAYRFAWKRRQQRLGCC